MSAAFYVLDTCGDKFLFTVADADYEADFRKHARWWLGHMKRPRYDSAGRQVRSPCKPCKIVVEK